ncbi:helix-turn-helix transcriptional regulator [Nesterenkonia jeotgali]|uniref:helix-turn-helix transcriptional regulator n=1 Tax=Nesterenkonia jeotgali TaxID=317018 RepID=UPI0009FAF30B|nr:helix-turn-helix transcriptional regulator [Nesterenkonia jeotgali]
MRVKDPAALRRKRKNRQYTQRELAFLVRRSQTAIFKLENGQMRTLSEDLAVAIAARLGCDWEDLFELEENEIVPKLTPGEISTSGLQGIASGRSRKGVAA